MRKTVTRIVSGCALTVALCATAQAGVNWRGITEENHLGGRKASEGYLQGKVVLVDRWGLGCPPCRALLPRMEAIWQSFKTKPFVLLGGHCRGWGAADGVKALIAEKKLTYPIYENAGLAKGEPSFNAIPFLYVVDETGEVLYYGHDERMATQTLVTALTDMESPRTITQWKRFLNYEIANLPGRAMCRYAEFKKKYPAEAKSFEAKMREVSALPDIKKLVELVEFAKRAKDMRPFDPKKEAAAKAKFVKKLGNALTKYAPLKDVADPRMKQEAKNALADIKWVQAAQ